MRGIAGTTVLFRADASTQSGHGHVMRCLTLAAALREHGATCLFASRLHDGHMIERTRVLGFAAVELPPLSVSQAAGDLDLHHDHGTLSTCDALQTMKMLGERAIDLLVVDHYGLDATWEDALRPHARKIMVIDDVPDRSHSCDLLLDQNLGTDPADYRALVPRTCRIVTGPSYALLRPQFSQWRQYSLDRRALARARRLLVSMGGTNVGNCTGRVLKALQGCRLSQDLDIKVVIGASAPGLTEVLERATRLPWRTDVFTNVENMAELMASSDFAIGAGGSTSWERCCMGLPTVSVVLADNQRKSSLRIQDEGACVALELGATFDASLARCVDSLAGSSEMLTQMGRAAARIVDGKGCQRVVDEIRRLLATDSTGDS